MARANNSDGSADGIKLPDDWGTHATHCCPVHGCKYESLFEEESTCPVVLGLVEREKDCGWRQEPHLVNDPEVCRRPGERMPVPKDILERWDQEDKDRAAEREKRRIENAIPVRCQCCDHWTTDYTRLKRGGVICVDCQELLARCKEPASDILEASGMVASEEEMKNQ